MAIILKHMFNKPKTYNTDCLFRELDLLKLQDIITLEQCKLGYKLVNNKIPNPIKRLMQQKGGKKNIDITHEIKIYQTFKNINQKASTQVIYAKAS